MHQEKKYVEPNDKEATISEDDQDEVVEIVSLDLGEEGEDPPILNAETTADLLRDAQEENYADEIARHTTDETIQAALEERQDLNSGRAQLHKQLTEHHAKSPDLSGGDVDADWNKANVGEETVGGMTPTPDQDVVSEIGEAYGISYEDDEPLQTEDKLKQRDQQRWELDPESAEKDV